MYELLIAPFIDFAFLKRALVVSMMVSCSSGVIGIFLVMKRMSLVGDALSHGILPGIALGFLIFGFSLTAMSIGGILAGMLIALCSFWVSKYTNLKEDATFAAFYLISLAVGVVIISKAGSQTDLVHILFGSVLAVDRGALIFVWLTMVITFLLLAVIYRPLVLYIMDPVFLKAIRIKVGFYHSLFLVLVVLNLVAGFQALGSLMAVGLLMLPAITSQLWMRSLEGMLVLVLVLGVLISYLGLLFSYHYDFPSGPSIIGAAGVIYLFSLFFGQVGGIFPKMWRLRHKNH